MIPYICATLKNGTNELIYKLETRVTDVESHLIVTRGWKDPWRRERLPIQVFWPGEFHGLCNPWDHQKLDTTE